MTAPRADADTTVVPTTSAAADDVDARLRLLSLRENEYGFDPFGASRRDLRQAINLSRFFYRHYFRTECHGAEHIPPTGRVLFIGNHSGQLPFDGVMIGAAAFLEPAVPRLLRAMVEHFVPSVPFASYVFGRWGQIVGTPENCARLLAADEAVLVFPEGARGISKPFTKRYQLQPFGLGFMRLALEFGVPIVPVAVIGAEEQAPAVNFKRLARMIGAPSLPIVPYPPFVPLLPLPTKYRLYFGAPMTFAGDHDDDDHALSEMAEQVRARIQGMVDVGRKERRHVFW